MHGQEYVESSPSRPKLAAVGFAFMRGKYYVFFGSIDRVEWKVYARTAMGVCAGLLIWKISGCHASMHMNMQVTYNRR